MDSHCHLDFPEFDSSRSDIIKTCEKNHIKKFVVPGVSQSTWHRLPKLKKQYSQCEVAFGLHPYFIEEHQTSHLLDLESWLDKYKPVAVGEIGLDFFNKSLDKKKQRELFSAQLDIASRYLLPVILHVRKAHDEVIQSLKKSKLKNGGVVHAFNGSLQQANQYMDHGFKFGFGGALTFDNATHLRALASALPLNSILLETDSPDMKPVNYQEPLNTPLTLLSVLDCFSSLRDEKRSDIADQVASNTKALFKFA